MGNKSSQHEPIPQSTSAFERLKESSQHMTAEQIQENALSLNPLELHRNCILNQKCRRHLCDSEAFFHRKLQHHVGEGVKKIGLTWKDTYYFISNHAPKLLYGNVIQDHKIVDTCKAFVQKYTQQVVPDLSTWTYFDFMARLTFEELTDIWENTVLHIFEITKGMVDESNFRTAWQKRIEWTEAMMGNRFYLTHNERREYQDKIVCAIRGYQLSFRFIWGRQGDNYRLFDLLSCCHTIFRTLCDLRRKMQSSNDRSLNSIRRHILIPYTYDDIMRFNRIINMDNKLTGLGS